MIEFSLIYKNFLNATLIICTVAIFSCQSSNITTLSQNPKDYHGSERNFIITASSIQRNEHQAIFKDNVKLEINTKIIIYSDKLIFDYSKSELDRHIEFIGNVRLISGSIKITSKKAFSDSLMEYLEFEDNVKVHNENNTIKYDHYIHYFKGNKRYIEPDIQAAVS